MATHAKCLIAKRLLSSAPYRCTVRIYKRPQITATGGDTPGATGVDDYLIEVTDPRCTFGENANQAVGYDPVDIITASHQLRKLGPIVPDGDAGAWSGHPHIYDLETARWGAFIRDAETIFGIDVVP